MCHKVLLIFKNVILFSITSQHPSSDWCPSIMTNANVSGRSYFSTHFRIRDIKDISSTRWVIAMVMWYNQIRISNSRAGDGLSLTLFFAWSKTTSVLKVPQETRLCCRRWAGTYSFDLLLQHICIYVYHALF